MEETIMWPFVAGRRDRHRSKRKYRATDESVEYYKRQEKYNTKIKEEVQKSKFKSILSNLKFETYTKRLVALVVIISLIDLQLSYVLAFMDKTYIAESLSSQICVTLLGTIIAYAVRAYFDTKAEKRDEMIKNGLLDGNVGYGGFRVPKSVTDNKFNEVISNSGNAEHHNDDTVTEDPSDAAG